MLSDYLSIYDPIENTPLIPPTGLTSPSATPGYYDSSFGKKSKRKRRAVSKVKAQKRKIGYTIKKGRVVHVYKISGKPGRRYYNGNKLIKGKRCYTTKAKANAALKKAPRKRSPRSGRRKSSFGSWWDNTQLTYCNPGTECANASTLGGKYPFYNDNKLQ